MKSNAVADDSYGICKVGIFAPTCTDELTDDGSDACPQNNQSQTKQLDPTSEELNAIKKGLNEAESTFIMSRSKDMLVYSFSLEPILSAAYASADVNMDRRKNLKLSVSLEQKYPHI